MAKAKKVAKATNKVFQERNASRVEPLKSEEKIARLLGLLAVQNVKWKPAQAMLLRGAGFMISEIAEMFDISDNAVSVLIYTAKKGKRNDDAD